MKKILTGLGLNRNGGVDVDEPERLIDTSDCRQCNEILPAESEALQTMKYISINEVDTPSYPEPVRASILDVRGYEDLRKILDLAYKQAAIGKGKERHGVKGEDWTRQPILRHQKAYGIGFALGQAAKKMEEAMALPPDRAKFELLGAIVYVAAAYRFLEEQNE